MKTERNYKFIQVLEEPNGKSELADFIREMVAGKSTFRYFQNRSIDVIHSHEATILLRKNGCTIAYGHLERQSCRLWLGIAVADAYIGQGWGKLMMLELVREAISLGFTKISLRVDHENTVAHRLYKQIGFKDVLENGDNLSFLMEKHIS